MKTKMTLKNKLDCIYRYYDNQYRNIVFELDETTAKATLVLPNYDTREHTITDYAKGEKLLHKIAEKAIDAMEECIKNVKKI